MEDYIKCELIGGGSSRHLKHFSNLFIVAVHYTHINTQLCIVAIVDFVEGTHVKSATASFAD